MVNHSIPSIPTNLTITSQVNSSNALKIYSWLEKDTNIRRGETG